MKITILNTSANHPVNDWLDRWISSNKNKHRIDLIRSKKELKRGDLLFLISCSEILSKNDLLKYKKALVIHASDLPEGRGWSPHIWEILNGSEQITLSLLEVDEEVDSGDIWKKLQVHIPKTALYNEINEIIFDAEVKLMDYAVEHYSTVVPTPQRDAKSSYWPKRKPEDSELDINKSIEEQFNLIRVCDSERFPAFFLKDGRKFKLKLEVDNE